MAVVYALVAATPNMLKYLVTSAGAESGNLEAAGAATPDMLTDAKPGSPLRAILSASYASAALARTALFGSGNVNVSMQSRLSTAAWSVDAGVNGTAPRITCASAAADAQGSFLIIEHRHTMMQ